LVNFGPLANYPSLFDDVPLPVYAGIFTVLCPWTYFLDHTRISHPFFIAKVGQHDQYPINFVLVFLEEIRTNLCVFVGFYRSQLRIFFADHNWDDVKFLKNPLNIPPGFCY
jgi:hypothetical protein